MAPNKIKFMRLSNCRLSEGYKQTETSGIIATLCNSLYEILLAVWQICVFEIAISRLSLSHRLLRAEE